MGSAGLIYLNAQVTEESAIVFRQMESIDNGWTELDAARELTTLAEYDTMVSGTIPKTLNTATSGEFSLERKVIAVNNSPDYAIIEATSTWTDSNGDKHVDTFRTAVARP